jgi:hypothetical protein
MKRNKLSLQPLRFKEAVSDLLKIKPEVKRPRKSMEKIKQTEKES